MTRLWQALGLLAQNANGFRDRVAAVANMENRPELPADSVFQLQRQGTTAALAAIDGLFSGEKDLHLCAYELAEINRWLWEDKNLFEGELVNALDAYWAALQFSAGMDNRSVLEAVGALAIDRSFRQAASPAKLSSAGFALSQAEAENLVNRTKTGTDADNAAGSFFALGWSGSTCHSVIKNYSGWFSSNA